MHSFHFAEKETRLQDALSGMDFDAALEQAISRLDDEREGAETAKNMTRLMNHLTKKV